MVRRITMEEAAADFKGIVERALANGDGYDVEQDGRVVLEIRPAPTRKEKITLGQFFQELRELWPDEDFAKDVEEGMRWSRGELVKDKWEEADGNSDRHQRPDSAGT